MVGHSGIFSAAGEAVEAGRCLAWRRMYQALEVNGGQCLITRIMET